MSDYQTVEELEESLGANLKALRLDLNIDQHTLAARAGISTGALQNLENGKGSTVRTLAAALRALGRADWLSTVAPVASINPLSHTESAAPRQRASGARGSRG